MTFPRMVRVRQAFPRPRIEDIPAAVRGAPAPPESVPRCAAALSRLAREAPTSAENGLYVFWLFSQNVTWNSRA